MRKTKLTLAGWHVHARPSTCIHSFPHARHWDSTQIHVAPNLAVPLFLPSKIRSLPIFIQWAKQEAGRWASVCFRCSLVLWPWVTPLILCLLLFSTFSFFVGKLARDQLQRTQACQCPGSVSPNPLHVCCQGSTLLATAALTAKPMVRQLNQRLNLDEQGAKTWGVP